MSFAKAIRALRDERGLTQRELGALIGVSDKAVSSWELGTKMPRRGALARLAEVLQISPATLMTLSCAEAEPSNVAPLPSAADCLADAENDNEKSPPPPLRRAPVLGRVPAGIPIEAVPDIIGTIGLDSSYPAWHDYFGLLVTGDSMLPEYRDGDIVILRVQETAETGDDVVAYIGDADATLKRITVAENGIQLRPLNPAYQTQSFTRSEVLALPVTIAGVVVEQRRLHHR